MYKTKFFACLAPFEQVKSILLTVAISIPALSCVLKIIELGGKYFYVYLWAFMFLFSLVMLSIVPTVIMPLFNTYSPLEVRGRRLCFGRAAPCSEETLF